MDEITGPDKGMAIYIDLIIHEKGAGEQPIGGKGVSAQKMQTEELIIE